MNYDDENDRLSKVNNITLLVRSEKVENFLIEESLPCRVEPKSKGDLLDMSFLMSIPGKKVIPKTISVQVEDAK